MFLCELTYPVSKLDGVGPVISRNMSELGIQNISDLLQHYPYKYENRKDRVPLVYSSAEKPALTVAEVIKHEYIHWKKGKALKVEIKDETDTASLLCFGRNFLADKLVPGKRFWIWAPFERNKWNNLQSSVFIFEEYTEEKKPVNFGRIFPVYHLNSALNQSVFRKAVASALKLYTVNLKNELPDYILKKKNFPGKKECLLNIHFPESSGSSFAAAEAIIFEELFKLQLSFARKRKMNTGNKKASCKWDSRTIEKLKELLPFSLTKDQLKAVNEIKNDIISDRPMSRLLQGEVGSGKTLVAFMAALGVIAGGGQAAFMAPTELLARQHADNAADLLEPLGINVAFISGDISSSGRKLLVEALKEGRIDLAVGTHALFSSDIHFKKLVLAVIDEQHRFGVNQRTALVKKGKYVNVLALSATPIPRTLALTAFGDMDISVIRTMPSGRKPVITHLARMGNEEKVYRFVSNELAKGHKAYFVYPMIEESEKISLKNAEDMFRHLQGRIFNNYRGALLHSRINEEIKRNIMNDFKNGKLDFLAATSVVEVGVDVPEATCMVIEHAERFGLSALHQLRGRVGRSSLQSYCFLVYSEPLSEDAKHRLLIMKETTDGFRLAEEDLKIRGPGDMTGIRQSGFLKFKLADPVRDVKVLIEAKEEAEKITDIDPGFLNPENSLLRDLYSICPPFEKIFGNSD